MAGGLCNSSEYVEEVALSLFSEAMESLVMIDKTTTADGYGGIKTIYVEGAEFPGAVVYNSSIEARIGAVQGLTSLYTITTRKNVNLQYHDIVKRLSDNKVFRVTSDGDDQKTPASATLDMRNVTAEEYDLPTL